MADYKNIRYTAGIAAVSLVGLGFAFFALITSIIWIPALLIASPFLVAGFFAVKRSPAAPYVENLYLKAYDWAFYRSEGARRFLWQGFYDFICWLYPQVQWKVMNYGYAIFNNDGKLIENLDTEFEEERFPLQLYHYIATCCRQNTSLQGKTVLEVGSGRGGGLNYVSTALKPIRALGVDLSQNQVEFCQRAYASNPNIQFIRGDSEHLTENPELQGNQFDLIINVESSHCYGNFKNFVQGVDKLLKSGGYFAFTDFRNYNEVEQLEKDLQSFNMKITKREDITVNVLHALKLDEVRRTNLINGFVHSWLRPLFKKFSGLAGSRINQAMESRETLYLAYVLKKD